jgi:TetR/AcrR family transcriptional repressor of nem operon
VPAPYASVDKRIELVRSAALLLHEQGFQRTTLADVAGHAGVPLGNVYYYFKTKEALAESVILAHVDAIRARLEAWVAVHEAPGERLRRLVRAPLDNAERVIQFGCPHGSLCQELEKLGPDAPLAKAAATMLHVFIDWASEQFGELGHTDREARAYAIQLIAGIQGTMLVAHTMRSPELLSQQLRRLEKSFDEAFTPKSTRRRS